MWRSLHAFPYQQQPWRKYGHTLRFEPADIMWPNCDISFLKTQFHHYFPGVPKKNGHAPICNRLHSCNTLAGSTYTLTVAFLTFAPFGITVSATIATNPDTDKLQQTLRRSSTKWTCPSTPYWAFYIQVRPSGVGLRHKCCIGRGIIFRYVYLIENERNCVCSYF